METATEGWSTYKSNARNTSHSTGATPGTEPSEGWQAEPEDSPSSAGGIAVGDETVVASFGTPYDGLAYAVDRETGEVRWTAKRESLVATTPVDTLTTPTIHDGTVYVGFTEQLVALSLDDGSVRWSKSFGGGVQNGIQVVDDSVIVNANLTLFALDPETGEIRWSRSGMHAHGPAVVDGELVQVKRNEGIVRLAAGSGETVWTGAGENVVPAGIAVFDGVAYVTGFNKVALAVDLQSGEQRWRVEGDKRMLAPAVVGDLLIYTNTGSETVALDRETGAQQWRTDVGANSPSTPRAFSRTVLTAGRAREDDSIVAIDAATGEKRWGLDRHVYNTGAFAAADGDLYIADADRLAAFDTGDGSPE